MSFQVPEKVLGYSVAPTKQPCVEGGENTPKSCSPYWRLWHQQQIIRCATATFPDNAGLFRIYRTCYIFKRTEWEGKRTEPKRNFTEGLRKNLENIMRHPYLCIVNERQASVFTLRGWLGYAVAVFSPRIYNKRAILRQGCRAEMAGARAPSAMMHTIQG